MTVVPPVLLEISQGEPDELTPEAVVCAFP